MSYMDFALLVTEMYKASKQPEPNYLVIKDLFDAVDIKKDGYIDLTEWNQTFNNL
jgi:Ca2+-binding EF-hand superfamily protein